MPPPTLFDPDGERDGSRNAAGEHRPAGEHDSSGGAPNYLVRRSLVVGAVVAVIAVAAVVVGSLIGGSDDDDAVGTASVEWNRVVLVDQGTGRIAVTDETGDEQVSIDTDVRPTAAAAVVGPTAVLTSADTTTVVDLESEEITASDIPAETLVTPAGSTLTMVVPSTNGQRGLLVHGPSGDIVDTAELAPVAGAVFEFAESRTDASGRHVLVTDSGNFQSVLFSFDRDEPSFFAGLALAVDADTVVTTQNVGDEATVSVFDHDGELVTSGRTPSVRAGMITDAGIQLVTVDGQILTMDGDGETDTGDPLDIGTIESGQVMPTGDRLVVTGSTGSAIVDDTGSIVARLPDALLPNADAARGATCVPLVRSTSAGDDEVIVIDARDGDTVAEAQTASAARILTSADGCTIGIVLDTGFEIVDADGVTSIDDDVLAALSPDARATLVERDRRIVLTLLDEPDAEPTDLAPRGRGTFFTEM